MTTHTLRFAVWRQLDGRSYTTTTGVGTFTIRRWWDRPEANVTRQLTGRAPYTVTVPSVEEAFTLCQRSYEEALAAYYENTAATTARSTLGVRREPAARTGS